MPRIDIKRAYDKPSPKDGKRILIDRLWPRGLEKAEAHFDEWAKELAPSASLRKWYGHDPYLWPQFQKQYMAELKKNKKIEAFIEEHEQEQKLTLLFAGKDTEHTHAIVLQHYLQYKYEGN